MANCVVCSRPLRSSANAIGIFRQGAKSPSSVVDAGAVQQRPVFRLPDSYRWPVEWKDIAGKVDQGEVVGGIQSIAEKPAEIEDYQNIPGYVPNTGSSESCNQCGTQLDARDVGHACWRCGKKEWK
jgi:hypothetical protein